MGGGKALKTDAPAGAPPGSGSRADPSVTIPACRPSLDALCDRAAGWGFLEPFRLAARSLQGSPGFWLRVIGGQWLGALVLLLGVPILAAGSPSGPWTTLLGATGFALAVSFVASSTINGAVETLAAAEPDAGSVLREGINDTLPLFWLGIVLMVYGALLSFGSQVVAAAMFAFSSALTAAASPTVRWGAECLTTFVVGVMIFRWTSGLCLAVPELVLVGGSSTRAIGHGFTMASSETTNLFAFSVVVQLAGAVLRGQFLWLAGKLGMGRELAAAGLGTGAPLRILVDSPLALFLVVTLWLLGIWWLAVWTYRYLWERGRERALASGQA